MSNFDIFLVRFGGPFKKTTEPLTCCYRHNVRPCVSGLEVLFVENILYFIIIQRKLQKLGIISSVTVSYKYFFIYLAGAGYFFMVKIAKFSVEKKIKP